MVAGLAVLSSTTAVAAEPTWPLQPGWPVATDLGSARPMNMPIEGSTGTSGWSKASSPTLADLDHNGSGKEIIIGSLDGRVHVYSSNGALRWNRYLDADVQAGPVNGSPAVGDIDGDGSPEVVAGSDNGWVFAWSAGGTLKPGWPQFTGWNADHPARCATNACTGVIAGPTLADLDGDGALEVIVGSHSHLMYVWKGNGSVLPGWPRDVWDGVASGAAVGDLDRDGRPEIVVGSDVESDCSDCRPYGAIRKGGLVHAFTISGDELPGWPVHTDSFMAGAPALADLDANGSLEVLVGGGYYPTELTTRGHHLVALNADGSQRWSFQTHGVLLGAPAVADLTGDGRPEIFIADATCLNGTCAGGYVYRLQWDGSRVWESQGITSSAGAGSGAYFSGPVLGDVTGDGSAEIVAADGNWHVKAWTLAGDIVADTGTTFALFGSPAIGDLDGDGSNEVVVGSAANNGPRGGTLETLAGAGKFYAWDTAGRAGLAFPQYQSRVVPTAFTSTPVTPVYRFWSPGFNNAHFFTTSLAEVQQLRNYDRNWRYEGRAFAAYAASGQGCTTGSPVYRFYSARFQTHFFTISEQEKQNTSGDANWSLEGVAYCAGTSAQPGTLPLYRFWSARFSKHFFTASEGEMHQLRTADSNWAYEGVVYYVRP